MPRITRQSGDSLLPGLGGTGRFSVTNLVWWSIFAFGKDASGSKDVATWGGVEVCPLHPQHSAVTESAA